MTRWHTFWNDSNWRIIGQSGMGNYINVFATGSGFSDGANELQ